MNYHKGFIVPLLLVLTALLLIAGGAYIVYLQQKQANPPATENVALPQATSTTPATSQTTSTVQSSDSQTVTDLSVFSSPLFGLTFEYNQKTMVVENDGATVYIDFAEKHRAHEGDSLQVFKKTPSDSLIDAIKKVVYMNAMPASCTVYPNTHRNFTLGITTITTASVHDSSRTSACGVYEDFGSPGFFFEDTSHPASFYFIRTGTAFGPGTGTISWTSTLKVSGR